MNCPPHPGRHRATGAVVGSGLTFTLSQTSSGIAVNSGATLDIVGGGVAEGAMLYAGAVERIGAGGMRRLAYSIPYFFSFS
jgi:hypothetical protein